MVDRNICRQPDESEIKEIEDIGGVCEESMCTDIQKRYGEIVGIVSYTELLGCVSCEAKVLENKVVGTCGKCGLKQKMTRCKKNAAARVMIQDDETKRRTVSMFDKTIRLPINELVDVVDDVQTKLLSVGAKYFVINSQNVIVHFESDDKMEFYFHLPVIIINFA